MSSFGNLVCEDGADGDRRSVTIRVKVYPSSPRFWWLCLLFQLGVYVALGVYIHQIGWETWREPQPHEDPGATFWILCGGIFLSAFVSRAAQGYAEERASQLSAVHPRLHHALTLQWPDATYREGLELQPSAILDGRALVAGDLLGVATGRAERLVRTHVVFRDAAVELDAVWGIHEVAANAFARDLASRLHCEVATEAIFSFSYAPGYRLLGFPGFVSILAAIVGLGLFVGHQPAGLYLLLASLGLNLVIASWGVRQMGKTRREVHKSFMRRFDKRLRFVAPAGPNEE